MREMQTHSVASLKPNDFGLFDMQGNAQEWCYDAAESRPDDRVLRGGSFVHDALLVRSAFRLWNQPVIRNYFNGFRPARTYHEFR